MDRLYRKFHFSPPQVLALLLLGGIILGTLFLLLPISRHGSISLVDAFFTATSAVTVTGLVVVNIDAQFTVFGQVILMTLMQIGGLGFMSFAVLAVLMLGKRIGIKQRLLLQEALNQTSIGGLVKIVRLVLVFAFSVELVAALLLSIRLVPELGLGEGIYASIFHSISAFNNAGFSLWSDSLTGYVGDPVMNIVISCLFITGGIGFSVISDLYYNRKFRDLSLHTKIMLISTLAINLTAMLVIFLLEYSNPMTLGNLPMDEKLFASYFQAVVPRSSGFNTIDISSMSVTSILLMLILMFIGAGSASTGGGVKVTTFIVLVLAVVTYIKGKSEPVIFRRTISNMVILRSLAIVNISIVLILLSVFILTLTEDAPLLMIVFEAFSAFGTVGLSMGLTPELSIAGKVLIASLMFFGRLGPLTLAFSLYQHSHDDIRYPEGQIFTG